MKKYMSGGDVKKVKSIAKSEVKGHETKMHGKGYAKGGVTNTQTMRTRGTKNTMRGYGHSAKMG
jgi:hypothetical protein